MWGNVGIIVNMGIVGNMGILREYENMEEYMGEETGNPVSKALST
jgi:hypothetical protein